MEDATFSNLQIDAIGEILNISLGASATSISNMLDRRVDITIPVVELATKDKFDFQYMEPAVGVEIEYVKGLDGKNVMLLKRADVKVILEILMGTTYTDEEFELDELAMSAVSEVMNQMMGASATALSEMIGEVIDISTPKAYEIETVSQFAEKYLLPEDEMVVVRFTLTIADAVESEFLNVISLDFARKLLMGAGMGGDDTVAAPEHMLVSEDESANSGSGTLSQEEIEKMMSGASGLPEGVEAPAADSGGGGGMMSQEEIEKMMSASAATAPAPAPAPAPVAAPTPAPPREQAVVNVRPTGHEEYGTVAPDDNKESIDLIMDVPLEVSVEIGRATKHVKEILAYNEGSLIVLDKLAGEQVDIYANGHQIAKGDVVVVDDCFGVRITEVIKRYKEE